MRELPTARDKRALHALLILLPPFWAALALAVLA